MRRTTSLLGLFVTCVLAAATAAQDPARPPRDSKPFRALEARVGGAWQAHWNAATGSPSAIYGTGLPIADWRGNSLEEARRCALRLLAEQADLLQLGASEFRESIAAHMGRTWSFKFDQYFRNLPCIGGRADVRVNMQGVVAMFGSTAWPIPADFDVTPCIDERAAEATAWLALREAPRTVRQPAARPNRLVVFGDVTATARAPFHLAWEIPVSNVDREGNGPIGRYYIDGKTGAVLHFADDKHSCGTAGCTGGAHASPTSAAPVATTVTVLAWTRTGLSATAQLTNVPVVGLEVAVPGIGSHTTDQNGQFTIDIAAPVQISVGSLDGVHQSPMLDPTQNTPSANVVVQPGVPATLQILSAGASPEQAAHANTYHWVHRGNEWARSILGNSAELAAADQVVPSVNTAGTCNAYYTNNTINFYPTAGGCNNTAFSTVVLHEWGHGLDDRYGGISNANGDGLSEGWADIVSMYLVDDPIVGLDFWNGGFIRTGQNGTMYGTQTQVHAAGQVWMGFAWQVRENLRASLGQTNGVALSNDIVVGSIVADATNQAAAVLEVFVADDNDGNLANGVPHYAELSAAAVQKGLPYPQIQVAWINHAALADGTDRFTPRVVTATTGVVSGGSITQARLVYSTNGGQTQVRTMVEHPTPGSFRALLPGIESGQVVYHVEATHSSGNVVRNPTTGEHRYTIAVPPSGPFAAFYAEGFDGAATGWSHGALSGPDEWQQGAPNGSSGSSYGVAWSDPAAPASGPGAYGVDLGGAFGNGSYQPDMYCSLRSPVFNCSNRTGVHLRFRRWLTCEEGQYDKAMILVNGNVVWQNPEFGQFIDTAWQQVEYAIPVADGNAAVQVEFVLTSDSGLELGGWNIDDFELGTRTSTPLPITLRWLPEQVGPTGTTAITVRTPGPQIFAIGIGDTEGPTVIAPVPPLLIGGGLITFSAFTDATGTYTSNLPPLGSVGAGGLLWFSQAVTIDPLGTFLVSNQHKNLFTP